MEGLDDTQLGIQDAIYELTILEDAVAKDAFLGEPRLLQDAHGSGVPGENWCLQSREWERLECIRRHGPRRRGSDAFAPGMLAKPIAEVSGVDSQAALRNDADTADRLAIELDGEVQPGILLCVRDPELRISLRIGMRERIKEITPDGPVIGVAHKVLLVG